MTETQSTKNVSIIRPSCRVVAHHKIIKQITKNAKCRKISDRHYEFNGYILTKHQMPRAILVEFLGGKCFCGFDNLSALQLDHIMGDGAKERRYFKSSKSLYDYYLNHLDEAKRYLQVLCANCNWIKKARNQEGIQHMRRGYQFEKLTLGDKFTESYGSRFEGGHDSYE